MKRIWKYLLPMVFAVLNKQVVCVGQNLVPNPSFENYTSCPTNLNQVDSVVDWFAVAFSPDYYNSCSSIVSVPDNYNGYQNARTGNAYCGMISYIGGSSYREYIGAQLISSLEIGQKYFISFGLSPGEKYSSKRSNKFGCKLSTVPFGYNIVFPNNQANFFSNTIVTDTLNWTYIKGSCIADSAYTYIAFGNFFDSNNTDTTQGGFDRTYYFIDDVCLSTDSLLCQDILGIINEPSKYIPITVVPNPCHDSFTISSLEKISSYKLFDDMGRVCIENNLSTLTKKEKVNVLKLNRGIYFLQSIINSNVLLNKIIIN